MLIVPRPHCYGEEEAPSGRRKPLFLARRARFFKERKLWHGMSEIKQKDFFVKRSLAALAVFCYLRHPRLIRIGVIPAAGWPSSLWWE